MIQGRHCKYFAGSRQQQAARTGSESQKPLLRELKTAAATAPRLKQKKGRAAKYWDWRGGKDRHSRRSEAARRRRFLRGQLKQLRAKQAAEKEEADRAPAAASSASASSSAAARPETSPAAGSKAVNRKLHTKPKGKPQPWTSRAVPGQVTVDCRAPPLPKRLRQATGAKAVQLAKAEPTFPRLTLRPKPGPKPKPPAKPPPPPEKFIKSFWL